MNSQQNKLAQFSEGSIYFIHIRKTAGRSLASVLNKADRQRKNARVDNTKQYFFQCCQNPGQFKNSIIGTHFNYGLHLGNFRHLLGLEKYAYVTILRDPVERAISFYYYILRERPAEYEHPLFKKAKECGLKEFYEWGVQNIQVKHLCNPNFFSNPSLATKVEQAKYNLEHKFAYFGISEYFSDSVRLLNHVFGWNYPLSDLPTKNKNAQRPEQENISAETLDYLREVHQPEYEVYDFAVKLFKERVALLPVEEG
ncbi:MAG: sulfotransferase family 2 domain-containing protein [Cyanobacteria bacterium P01_H01_bin.15]